MMSRQNSTEETDSNHFNAIPITFRSDSIRSSLSSLYKNYDFHLDILKLTGVIVLVSMISATLAVINNVHVCARPHKMTDCIILSTASAYPPLNSRVCN